MSLAYKLGVTGLYILLGLWMLAGWHSWDRLWRVLTPVVFIVVGGGALLAFGAMWLQP